MNDIKNAITFKNVNDEILNLIEKSVQTKLENYLSKLESELNAKKIDKNDFFGEHSSNTTQFEFSIGERMLIKELSLHVKRKVDCKHPNSDLKYFTYASARKKLKDCDYNNTVFCSSVDGRFFNRKTHEYGEESITERKVNHDILTEDVQNTLKAKLFDKIKKKLLPLLGSDKCNDFNESTFSIELFSDNGVVKANFDCILCDQSNNETNRVKVSCKPSNDLQHQYWVLSNFITHLDRKHGPHSKNEDTKSIKSKKNSKAVNQKLDQNMQQSQTKRVQVISPDNTEGNIVDSNQNNQQLISFDQHHVITNYHTLPIDYDFMEEQSTSFIDLEFDPCSIPNQSTANSSFEIDRTIELNGSKCIALNITGVDMNTSNLRKSIYQQISEQISKINDYVILNNEKEEAMKFQINGAEHILNVVEVQGDGSCLFRAIIHQLYGDKVNSSKHNDLARKLREDVVEFIETHSNHFIEDIRERVENREGITKENIDAECEKFVTEELKDEVTWGGGETMKAVSSIYGVNILIFEESGKYYYRNGFNPHFETTICLAYTFFGLTFADSPQTRIHYNSVSNIEGNHIFSIASILSKKEDASKLLDQDIEVISDDSKSE